MSCLKKISKKFLYLLWNEWISQLIKSRTNESDLLKFYWKTQIAVMMNVVIIVKTTKKLLIDYIHFIIECK